jgi:hypothetical protein
MIPEGSAATPVAAIRSRAVRRILRLEVAAARWAGRLARTEARGRLLARRLGACRQEAERLLAGLTGPERTELAAARGVSRPGGIA